MNPHYHDIIYARDVSNTEALEKNNQRKRKAQIKT